MDQVIEWSSDQVIKWFKAVEAPAAFLPRKPLRVNKYDRSTEIALIVVTNTRASNNLIMKTTFLRESIRLLVSK